MRFFLYITTVFILVCCSSNNQAKTEEYKNTTSEYIDPEKTTDYTFTFSPLVECKKFNSYKNKTNQEKVSLQEKISYLSSFSCQKNEDIYRQVLLVYLYIENSDILNARASIQKIKLNYPSEFSEIKEYLSVLEKRIEIKELNFSNVIKFIKEKPIFKNLIISNLINEISINLHSNSYIENKNTVLDWIDELELSRLNATDIFNLANILIQEDNATKQNKALEFYKYIFINYPQTEYANYSEEKIKKINNNSLSSKDYYFRAKKLLELLLNEKAIRSYEEILSKFNNVSNDELCLIHYDLGVAYQNLRKYTKAEEDFIKAVNFCKDNEDQSAKSLFRLGRGALRKSELSKSEDYLESLKSKHPKSSLLDDLYLIISEYYSNKGNFKKSNELAELFINYYPDGDMLSAGYWLLAWNSFKNNQNNTAIEIIKTSLEKLIGEHHWFLYNASSNENSNSILEDIMKNENNFWQYQRLPSEKQVEAKLLYWYARLSELENKTTKKQLASMYSYLAIKYINNYYGIMAFNRLSNISSDFAKKVHQYLAEIKSNLKQYTPQNSFSIRLKNDSEIKEIKILQELTKIGIKNDIRILTNNSILNNISNTNFEYVNSNLLLLSFLYKETDNYDLSLSALKKLNKTSGYLEIKNFENNKNELLVQFPDVFDLEMKKASNSNKIPLELLLGLCREESLFDPKIQSWAGAIGLSQLMPSTGRELALRHLKIKDIEIEKLYNVDINLTLGAAYLSNLIKMFNHNALVIASYNAGEGAVKKWKKEKLFIETDVFIEEIPYQQTKDYVKRVASSYQTYNFIYNKNNVFIDVPMKIIP